MSRGPRLLAAHRRRDTGNHPASAIRPTTATITPSKNRREVPTPQEVARPGFTTPRCRSPRPQIGIRATPPPPPYVPPRPRSRQARTAVRSRRLKKLLVLDSRLLVVGVLVLSLRSLVGFSGRSRPCRMPTADL